jgi:ferrous iron transport protein A
MRLDELETGEEGIVTELYGPEKFMSRVCAFGFAPGARVMMIRNPNKGPLIAFLHDTLIAIGRAEAAGVGIEPAFHEPERYQNT